MAFEAMVYRVLISSPDDTEDEREAAKITIYNWNKTYSTDLGIVLSPVYWEGDAFPQFLPSNTGPQQIINKQLVDTCDMVVAFFWTRIGTKTEDFPSGTAEEVAKFRLAGKPVLLYFSEKTIASGCDPEQLKALADYRTQCKAQGLCVTYKSTTEFAERLSVDLKRTIESLDAPQEFKKRLRLHEKIDKNVLLREIVEKINTYSTLSERCAWNHKIKAAMATFFWNRYGRAIMDAGIRDIFFESGSTVGYLADGLRSLLQTEAGQTAFGKCQITTNNIIAYLLFVLTQRVHVDLRPDGPPESVYGATFGQIAAILGALPRKSDTLVSPLSEQEQEQIKQVAALILPTDRPSLLLGTASGLEVDPSHPFCGLHVGSFHNKLFKQAMLLSPHPIVQFLDASKVSSVNERGKFEYLKCHPVCNSQAVWRYVCDNLPLAFCVGGLLADERKAVESAMRAHGFEEDQCTHANDEIWVAMYRNQQFAFRSNSRNKYDRAPVLAGLSGVSAKSTA